MSSKSVHKSVLQQCFRVLRECFSRVCHKSVEQECRPIKVSHKSMPQESHARVSHTIVREECQARVFFKSGF